MSLLIPDLSEWQGTVDWRALVGGSYPAVIIRAHNGYRQDYQFARNRTEAHLAGVRALGLYHYLAADRDPVQQAADFVHSVGYLAAGEWTIVDCEDGSNAVARVQAFTAYVARAMGHDDSWLYSGESYYRANGLQAAGVPAARTWLAAYGPNEPSEPHALWQFTDGRTVPGVGVPVDCSTYPGTVEQLLATVTGSRPPAPVPQAPTWPGRYLELQSPRIVGDDVRDFQQRMHERHWDLGTSGPDGDGVDSEFGPIMDRVTREFQGQKGLTVDGIVGPVTWSAAWTAPVT